MTAVESRLTFNQAAQDYDAVRPGYPPELIADIVSLSRIPPGGSVVEVGCGAGQATLPFAQRGFRMRCLDIGPELAAIAAHKCRAYPEVQIETAAFEEWQSEETFDLLISATAFHWIAPEVGYAKAARVLNESGHIAIFRNLHPTPYCGFFLEVQPIYQRIVPEWGPLNQDPLEQTILANSAMIDRMGLFEPVVVKQYAWEQEYSAVQYVRLLNTYSDHRNLEENQRRELFAAIEAFINTHCAGKVRRPYLSVLYIAKKENRHGT